MESISIQTSPARLFLAAPERVCEATQTDRHQRPVPVLIRFTGKADPITKNSQKFHIAVTFLSHNLTCLLQARPNLNCKRRSIRGLPFQVVPLLSRCDFLCVLLSPCPAFLCLCENCVAPTALVHFVPPLHRGQVCMLAHQLGFPLPDKTAYGIWGWEKLWKELGFGPPRCGTSL